MAIKEIEGKRALALCILKVLEKYADERHPLSARRISELTDSDFGVTATRNTVYQNLLVLEQLGYRICRSNRGVYLKKSKPFTDDELRVLVDAVLTARFIPQKQAKSLAERLRKLGSPQLADRTKHIHSLDEYSHRRNTEFYPNLSALDQAIQGRRQVAFQYNRITTEGELKPEGERRVAHPYAIACAEGQYYLICSHAEADKLYHYRVDRLTGLKMLPERARRINEIPGYRNGFRLADYAAEHRFMYGGRPEPVILRMPAARAGDVVDAFGQRARMRELRDGMMEVRLTTAPEGVRWFALQFGPNCEVLSPPALRQRLRDDILLLAEKYGEEREG